MSVTSLARFFDVVGASATPKAVTSGLRSVTIKISIRAASCHRGDVTHDRPPSVAVRWCEWGVMPHRPPPRLAPSHRGPYLCSCRRYVLCLLLPMRLSRETMPDEASTYSGQND